MEKTMQERETLERLRRKLEQAFDRQDLEEAMRLSRLIDRLTVGAR